MCSFFKLLTKDAAIASGSVNSLANSFFLNFWGEEKNKMYEIRVAHEKDGEVLARFIDQHWRKNHIFVSCKELLDWQHLDKKREQYNFVIGIEKQTQTIHAILGFIPLSQFDPDIEFERLCWMAIWKVQDAARGHNLGRLLLTYLEENFKPAILCSIAASEMTLPMYRARGYQTGRMNHHFILNPAKSNFRLATIRRTGARSTAAAKVHHADKRIEPASESDLLDTADSFLLQNDLPRKSATYLVNRYLRHPIYRYFVYKICEGLKIAGFVVTRICSHEGARAIRVVDFIGPSDALRDLQTQWVDLLMNIDAEYIDFYSAGIDQGDLLASGFTRREDGDGFVIPNHFEPFVSENIEIDFMTSSPVGQIFRVVKGDSDQDRPNLIGRAQ
jgi:hypothetical protein